MCIIVTRWKLYPFCGIYIHCAIPDLCNFNNTKDLKVCAQLKEYKKEIRPQFGPCGSCIVDAKDSFYQLKSCS